MTDLSPRARAVLASARSELAPDAERIARGRDRLLAATAVTAATATVGGVAAANATTTAAATTTATATATTLGFAGIKLGALAAGLVVAVAVGALVVPRLRAPAPAPSAIEAAAPAPAPIPNPDPTAAAPAAPIAPIAPIDPAMIELDPPVADRPVRGHGRGDRAAGVVGDPAAQPAAIGPSPTVDPLTHELDLLRAARAGLRAGATVAALATIATYQREFPRGQLAEEAAALELDLLCAAGRTDDVVRRRARFLARWPDSALRQRVERACRTPAR